MNLSYLDGQPFASYATNLNVSRLPSGYYRFVGQWSTEGPPKWTMTRAVDRLVNEHGAEVKKIWLDHEGNVVKQRSPEAFRKMWECHIPRLGKFVNWMSEATVDGKPRWWIDLKSNRIRPGSELSDLSLKEKIGDTIPEATLSVADLEMIYAAREFEQLWDLGEWSDPVSMKDMGRVGCWRKSRKPLDLRGAMGAMCFIAARAYGLFNVTVSVAFGVSKQLDTLAAIKMFAMMHKHHASYNELGGNFWAKSKIIARTDNPWYREEYKDLAAPRVAWEAFGLDTSSCSPTTETGYELWPGMRM